MVEIPPTAHAAAAALAAALRRYEQATSPAQAAALLDGLAPFARAAADRAEVAAFRARLYPDICQDRLVEPPRYLSE